MGGPDGTVARGGGGPDVDPRDAVRAFQREYNRMARTKLDEEGWCEPKTLTALGAW